MQHLIRILSFLLFCLIISSLCGQTFYYTGNTEDVVTEPSFGVLLAGGGGDNDDGMNWLLEKANGGDVLVLRASGSDGYNDYLYSGLGVEVNSVTTIKIVGTEQADTDTVCNAIANAEVIFMAGGDQWYYYSEWKNTCVQEKIQEHIENNKPIGGTSAGLAVLGEVVYTAENGSVTSEEALLNPFDNNITLENDFLNVPFLENTVTDSHYAQRDREGRHMTFLARMRHDLGVPARGIGINEYTAVALDENGVARVFGDPDYDDYAYFLFSNADPETIESSAPLHWVNGQQAVSVYALKGDFEATNFIDLSDPTVFQGGDWEFWWVDNGVLNSAPASVNAMQEMQTSTGLNIYPNPAEDHFKIVFDEAHFSKRPTLLQITSVKGDLIELKEITGFKETLFDISELRDGAYYICVYSDNKVIVSGTIIKE